MASPAGLRRQVVEMPLIKGLDTRDDPKLLPMGTLTSMSNLEINRVGRLETRRGIGYVASLPPAPPRGGTTDETLLGVVGLADDPLVYGQRRVNVWDADGSTYRYRGRAPGPAISSRVVQSSTPLSLVSQDSNSHEDSNTTVVASLEMTGDSAYSTFDTPRWRLHVDVISTNTQERRYSWTYDSAADLALIARVMVFRVGSLFYVVLAWTANSTTTVNKLFIDTILIDGTTSYTSAPTLYSYNSGNGYPDYGGLLDTSGGFRYVVIDGMPDTGLVNRVLLAFPRKQGEATSQIQFMYVYADGTYTLPGTMTANASWGIALAPTTAGSAVSGMLAYSGGTDLRTAALTGYTPGVPALVDATDRIRRIGLVATGNRSGSYGDEFALVYESDTTTGSVHTIHRAWMVTGGTAPYYILHVNPVVDFCSLMSRPFVQDSQVYVVLADQRGASYFLCDLNYVATSRAIAPDGNYIEPVSVILPMNAGGVWDLSVSDNDGYVQNNHLTTPNLAGAAWQVALPRAIVPRWNWPQNASPAYDLNPVLQSLLATAMVTMTFAAPANAAEVSGVARIAGGLVTECDYGRAYEVGFAWEPYGITLTASTPSGSTSGLDAGTYAYWLVYTYQRPDGTIERSAPSTPRGITVEAGEHVFGKFVPLTLTNKRSVFKPSDLPDTSLNVEVYRTLADGTEGHLVGTLRMPVGSALGVVGFTDLASFSDGLPDVVAQYGALLPATKAPFMPPSSTSVFEHQGRIGLAGCEDPTRVYLSLYLTPGEAAAFSPDTHYWQFPEAIVAGASMDGIGYAFSRTSIWYVAGDGPDDTATSGAWTQPIRIQSDVGCIDPRSVVSIPAGIMFQSDRGIYLLARDRTVSYVGAGIESLLRTWPVITSAVLCQDRRHVRFTAQRRTWSEHDNGITFSYFYEYDQWGTAMYKRNGDSATLPCNSACVVGTRYWLVASDGMYAESPLLTDANNAAIPTGITTGWVSMRGQLGWQRTWWAQFLAEYSGAATVTLSTTSDYDPSLTDTYTWTNTTARQLALHLWNTQKANAIRVSVAITPAAAGGSAQYDTIGFEMGMRSDGLKQLPAAQRGG